MEPVVGNESLGTEKMPRFNTPVCLVIRNYRYRLVDSDGISAKAAIDGLVKTGILADDTPEQIKKISFEQFEISKQEDEKTEIIIKSS